MAKETFFTSIEVQRWSNGGGTILTDHYEGIEDGKTAEERAYAKLYSILAAAAVSGLPYHSGHLLRSDGIVIDGRAFDRRTEEEPEPEPEPEEGTTNE